MAEIVQFDDLRRGGGAHEWFVETLTSQAVHRLFDCCRQERSLGLVVGVPGCGKTAAALAYRNQNPGAVLVTMGRRHSTDHLAMTHLLETIAGDLPPARSTADIHRTLLPILRPPPFQPARSAPPWARPPAIETDGPALLIVDEATYLEQAAADCIANLAEEARIGLVFVGNMDLHQRWFPSKAGERLCTAQFAARFAFRLPLEELEPDDVSAILRARGITGRAEIEYLMRIAGGFAGLHGVRHVLSAALIDDRSWPPRLPRLKDAAAMCGLE